MIQMILTGARFENQSCELPNGTWTLGRSQENQIVIRDESVSGRHCELLVYGSEVIVRELGSRNGTFVQGIRVKAQSGIRHGDEVRFGAVEVRFLIQPTVDEGATAVTALVDHRRVTGQPPPAAQAPSFPVVFLPRGQ